MRLEFPAGRQESRLTTDAAEGENSTEHAGWRQLAAVKSLFRIAIAKSFTEFLFRPDSRLEISPFTNSMREITHSNPGRIMILAI